MNSIFRKFIAWLVLSILMIILLGCNNGGGATNVMSSATSHSQLIKNKLNLTSIIPTEYYPEPFVDMDGDYCKKYDFWDYCGYNANYNQASGSFYLNKLLSGNIPSGANVKIMQTDSGLPSCSPYTINGCKGSGDSHSNNVAELLYNPLSTWGDSVSLMLGLAQDSDKYAVTAYNFRDTVSKLIHDSKLVNYDADMLAARVFPTMNQNKFGVRPDILVAPVSTLTYIGDETQSVRVGDYLFDRLNFLTVTAYPNSADGWGATADDSNYYNALIIGAPFLYPDIRSMFDYYTSTTVDNQPCITDPDTCKRPSPQLVAYSNSNATSWATSSVGSIAAMLETIPHNDANKIAAKDMRVMKSVIISGASKGGLFEFDNKNTYMKPHIWSPWKNHNWDKMAGYGVVNSYRSYKILAAQQVKPEQAGITDTGWDFNKLNTTALTKTYNLTLDAISTSKLNSCFTASLVWNRSTRVGVNNFIEAKPLEKISLSLTDASGKLVASSDDFANNVQYLYLPKLAAGSYKLNVKSEPMSIISNGTWDENISYGISWGYLDHCHDEVTPAIIKNNFVAVGDQGTILTSANSIDWVSVPTPTNNPIFRVIANNQGKLVAVGYNGTILTSGDNGAHWSQAVSGTTNQLNGIAVNNDGRFVAVGYNGTILTSSDGDNWSTVNSETYHYLKDVTVNGKGKFVAVGEGGLILSSDGGTNWITRSSGNGDTLMQVVVNQKGKFVAVGFNGAIVTSNDGDNWTSVDSEIYGFEGFLYGVTAKDNKFVAVGDNGIILVSYDSGDTWINIGNDSGTTNSLVGVKVNSSGKFVAVGLNGMILTSSYAKTWSSTDSGTKMSLFGINTF